MLLQVGLHVSLADSLLRDFCNKKVLPIVIAEVPKALSSLDKVHGIPKPIFDSIVISGGFSDLVFKQLVSDLVTKQPKAILPNLRPHGWYRQFHKKSKKSNQ
jgi:hypothetical protein